jgi:hypothetical protein
MRAENPNQAKLRKLIPWAVTRGLAGLALTPAVLAGNAVATKAVSSKPPKGKQAVTAVQNTIRTSALADANEFLRSKSRQTEHAGGGIEVVKEQFGASSTFGGKRGRGEYILQAWLHRGRNGNAAASSVFEINVMEQTDVPYHGQKIPFTTYNYVLDKEAAGNWNLTVSYDDSTKNLGQQYHFTTGHASSISGVASLTLDNFNPLNAQAQHAIQKAFHHTPLKVEQDLAATLPQGAA